MINTPILISLILLNGCFVAKSPSKKQSYLPEQCKIELLRDSLMRPPANVVGFAFNCEENKSVEKIYLSENNPWKKLNFPSLADSNKFIHFSSQGRVSEKMGFLYFDLQYLPVNQIKEEFPLSNIDDQYHFTYAQTDCRYEAYLPNYLLINYYVAVHARRDTNMTTSEIVYFVDNLKMYASNENIHYEIQTDDYLITGPKLDTINNLLFFRSSRLLNNKSITGIELHDLTSRKLWHKIEFNEDWMFYEPFQDGNYILVEATDNVEKMQYLFVVDILNKKVLKEKIKQGYTYSESSTNTPYIIYVESVAEGEALTDTLLLKDMTVIGSIK